MQTKEKNKTVKTKGVSQRLPKSNSIGGKRKQLNARLGKLQPGANALSFGNDYPFALNPFFKTIPELLVQELQGNLSFDYSEEAQLKVIKDLYPVIANFKGFKENKRWSNSTHPSFVLHDLFSQFRKIGKHEHFEIENTGEHYQLKVLNAYGSTDPIFVPLDFLSQINRSHKRLHDFIIYALALVKRYNSIQLFGDWVKTTNQTGTHGVVYESLLEQEDWYESNDELEDNNKHEIEATLKYYGPGGIPATYNKLINTTPASLKLFKQELDSFTPNNDFEAMALPFLKSAYDLANYGIDIHELCEQPWNNGEVTPCEYMACIWSWDDNDRMYNCWSEFLDDQAQNIGVSPFCWKETLTLESYKGNENICHSKRFISFFTEGNEMATKIKKKLEGKDAPQRMPLPINKTNKHGRLIDIIV